MFEKAKAINELRKIQAALDVHQNKLRRASILGNATVDSRVEVRSVHQPAIHLI